MSQALSRHEPAPAASVSSGVRTPDLHANEIADLALQALIECDHQIDGILALARQRGEQRGEPRSCRLGLEIGRKLLGELAGIGERKHLRERLDEEVERIDHGDVGDEVDRDGELARLVRKHQARQPISVRVLVPIDEVLGRRDLERVADDTRAAMGSGAQPDHLRAEPDRPIVLITRKVVETGEDRHKFRAQYLTGRKRVVSITLSSGTCCKRPISTSDWRRTASALASNCPSAVKILICSS